MIRVGVIRGGTGYQYEKSLATGGFVLQNLPKDLYETVDIYIDREGVWHLNGLPVSEAMLAERIDMVWNALHGFYGEDGKIQQVLQDLGIPYIGSDPFTSMVTMDKKLLRDLLTSFQVKVPRGIYIEDWGNEDREETVAETVRTVSTKLSPPWIVEPIAKGAGDGGIRANTRNELVTILSQMFELQMPVLVEEMVLGKDVSISTTTDFRGEPVYAFIPTEKDNHRTHFTKEESEPLQKLAKEIHKNMNLGHYSRVEATITPRGHIYVRNIETIPSLNEGADLHKALADVGSSFKELAASLISKAMGK
jgi:D-alanine-D-alanine ligase